MEKRVLLAVVLSFLVLTVYQWLVPAPPRTAPQPQAVQEEQATAVQPPPPEPAPETPPDGHTPIAEPTAAAAIADREGREIVVQTRRVRAVFSNRGAVITSWRLHDYAADATGEPVDLVPSDLPAGTPRPFTLRLEDPAATARVNTALFQPSRDGEVDGTGGPVTLDFTYEDAGLRVVKTFRLLPDSYVIAFSVDARVNGEPVNPAVQWGPGLGDSMHAYAEGSSFGTYVQAPQGILYADGSVERLTAGDVAEQQSWEGVFPFAGIDDHYFLASLVSPGLVRIVYEPVTAPMPDSPGLQRNMMAFEALFAEPPQDVRVFFGPKDFDVLQSVDQDLVRTIHYGIFAFLAVPLLQSLEWINGFVGNYGWSIILLTIVINFLMFPLRHKSVVSMRKMQALQPQVKAIQERYSKLKVTDPARQNMNKELMELYRQKGVNPASGCVPMLMTMPILFAFYSMLSVAIEIRGEPFALWITDLSQHDPLYITPVLMGVTMLIQQRMTPIADPAQQKIMMITPIMFLFFFLWAPSGLVLYWLVSNVLAIAQQYTTNRIIGAPVVSQVRPPAERRLKQAGAGRSAGARTDGP